MSENLFRDIIKSTPKWEGQEQHFESDSSPKAWEHYKKYYNGLDFIEDLNKVLVEDKERKEAYSRLKSNVIVGNITYKVVGDCSFNFNNKKKKNFENIINNDPNMSDDDKKKLKEYKDKHHTLLNFDLMKMKKLKMLCFMVLDNHERMVYLID